MLEALCEKGLPGFFDKDDVIADFRKLCGHRCFDLADIPMGFYKKCSADVAKLLVLRPFSSTMLTVCARSFMTRELTKPEIRKLVEGRPYVKRQEIYENIEALHKYSDGFKQLPIATDTIGKIR